jgi:hypothetical protein
LDKTQQTKIHIINKEDSKIDTFTSDESFYIFHYSEYNETENFIDIYASLYDELDFSQLNITGKYRMIHIDKASKQVTIEKSIQLEELDLDFPKTYQNKVVFRSIQDRIINGFVVCNKLKVEKQISFENRFICGEQAIKMIGQDLYKAFFYSYTKKQWGCEPMELPASILKRLPIRFNYNDNYYANPLQGIPQDGYTAIFEKLLNHPQIEVRLNTKFDDSFPINEYDHIFYTGPIDAFFNYKYGFKRN